MSAENSENLTRSNHKSTLPSALPNPASAPPVTTPPQNLSTDTINQPKPLAHQPPQDSVAPGRFHSNDRLVLYGTLGAEKGHTMKINGFGPMHVTARQHMLLTSLAQFGRYVEDAKKTGKQ